ncbi:hypothetical protein KFK09_000538 [Dendrobium nobile]|uniref:Uncharacterized protein n=1 Tax=Dendrobium nobile TaxID=94219 RepID=A0A8T3CE91_DENNO|nr:hypothetical protein KFK09_000538 [Dendrobium nobile]
MNINVRLFIFQILVYLHFVMNSLYAHFLFALFLLFARYIGATWTTIQRIFNRLHFFQMGALRAEPPGHCPRCSLVKGCTKRLIGKMASGSKSICHSNGSSSRTKRDDNFLSRENEKAYNRFVQAKITMSSLLIKEDINFLIMPLFGSIKYSFILTLIYAFHSNSF